MSDFDVSVVGTEMDTNIPQSDALKEVQKLVNEHLEKELIGAWRAGYDRVDVYDDMPTGDGVQSMQWSICQHFHPAHEGDARPDPDGMVYRYSYDLTSVSDDVMRKAIRGELDADEVVR
jgi:hypothetical protein